MGSQNDDDWFGADNKFQKMKKGNRNQKLFRGADKKIRHSIIESRNTSKLIR